MPRIPSYDGPQIQDQALPGARQTVTDSSALLRQAAAGANAAVEYLVKDEARRDQDTAFSTEAKVKGDWLEFSAKLQANRRGRDADSYPAEVEAWWKEQATAAAKDLSPGAQRLVGRSLMTSQLQARGEAAAYREHQLTSSATASYNAANAMSIEEALRSGTPTAVAKAQADIGQRIAERGTSLGWTPDQLNAERLTNSSILHSSVLENLARTDPTAAQAYFTRVKQAGEITAAAADAVGFKLEKIGATVDGNNAARDVWSALGPKQDFAPVETDKMIAAINTKFGNDPVRNAAARTALAELVQAQQTAEKERMTGNINSAYSQLNAGAPLSQVKLTDAWLKLPAHEQDRIIYEQEQRKHARIRAGADAASAQYHQLMAQDNLLAVRNWDDYMRLQNPTVLAAMTRPEVQSTQRIVGRTRSDELVKKWDELQKPAATVDAHLDADQFNTFAQKAGLSPNKPHLSEQEKNILISAKSSVENAIRQEQEDKKRALTPDERTKIIEREFSRTVVVQRTLLPNQVKPLIATTPDERGRILLTPATRDRAARLMQQLFQGAKNDADKKRYSPTPENLSTFVSENPELMTNGR